MGPTFTLTTTLENITILICIVRIFATKVLQKHKICKYFLKNIPFSQTNIFDAMKQATQSRETLKP